MQKDWMNVHLSFSLSLSPPHTYIQSSSVFLIFQALGVAFACVVVVVVVVVGVVDVDGGVDVGVDLLPSFGSPANI